MKEDLEDIDDISEHSSDDVDDDDENESPLQKQIKKEKKRKKRKIAEAIKKAQAGTLNAKSIEVAKSNNAASKEVSKTLKKGESKENS